MRSRKLDARAAGFAQGDLFGEALGPKPGEAGLGPEGPGASVPGGASRAGNRCTPPGLSPAVAALLDRLPPEAVLGLDEAGRGPLAGPVSAGAVILPASHGMVGLNDSKKLTEKKREALWEQVQERAFWGLGWAWPEEIEALNIHHASLLSMSRAWEDLKLRFPLAAALVQAAVSDGKFGPALEVPVLPQVKGDGLVAAVSAASIVAKVNRDRYMVEQDGLWPGYGFAKHKGYPSPDHRAAIQEKGPCPIHRLSWIGS